jgi:demethoxyubiquinone hydroxylase (CLK1/Coq7/Cat5 family)
LVLRDARPDGAHVIPAVRGNFLLQKGEERNSAVVALRDSLDGPQEIVLELLLRVDHLGAFGGKYIANLIIYVSEHRKQQ